MSHKSLASTACGITRRCYSITSSVPERLAFAFDIDGVLKQGRHVLPQAKRVLAMLSGRNGQTSGGMPEAERCKALSAEFEVEIGPNQLVQSHTPLQDYVTQYADKPVLVVGGVGDFGRRVAESYGLEQAYLLQDIVAWRQSVWDRYSLSPEERGFAKRIDFSTTPIHAIFVIHDHGMDWGLATQVILELLSSDGGLLGTRRANLQYGQTDGRDLPLILTNPDVVWGSEYPLPRLGMGAFRIGLEAVYRATTGVELAYTQFGKPHGSSYAFANRMLKRHVKSLGRDPDRELSVYMVGDNPESDIAGANAYGWSSVLVKTGVFREGKPSHMPTKIVGDVEEGVSWAFMREQNRDR